MRCKTILLFLAMSAPLRAQTVPAVADTVDRTSQMIAGGVLGGLLGFTLGMAVGYGVETSLTSCNDEYCGIGGAAIGAILGESLGIAYGVHTGNLRRGGMLSALAGPLAVAAGSLIAGSALTSENVPAVVIFIAVPVAQIATAIRGEVGAMKRRNGSN